MPVFPHIPSADQVRSSAQTPSACENMIFVAISCFATLEVFIIFSSLLSVIVAAVAVAAAAAAC